MRFSAEQAQEASEAGEPIWLDDSAADSLLREHGFDLYGAADEHDFPAQYPNGWDAWMILAWLGY